MSASRRPLRFATFLAPNMLPVYRFLADHLAAWLGHPVQGSGQRGVNASGRRPGGTARAPAGVIAVLATS